MKLDNFAIFPIFEIHTLSVQKVLLDQLKEEYIAIFITD